MRVLILAEECNPDWASVPSFTFQAICAIAKQIDAVVVTQVRNKADIERVGMGNARVEYIDTEYLAYPLWKLEMAIRQDAQTGWSLAHVFGYPKHLAFEWVARQRYGRALQRGRFDVVHRLTPWTGTQPSFMASSCPVPFLLGPLNDNLPWPDVDLSDVATMDTTRAERLGLTLIPRMRRLPYMDAKYRDATGILACYSHTLAGLPDPAQARAINFPEVGFDPAIFSYPNRASQTQKTVVFVGRLVAIKMPEVVVRAFADSSILRQHRLVIVGDGPERPRLERLIADSNLGDTVKMVGWKSLADVGQLMRQADILAFPSIHEAGGAVIVEAMACSLACVVVDRGGPATLVRADYGVKVPMGDLHQLTESFRQELEGLVADPERVTRMGMAAYHHAMTYYTWEAKARKTVEIYKWVTGQQAQKPDFWDQPSPPVG